MLYQKNFIKRVVCVPHLPILLYHTPATNIKNIYNNTTQQQQKNK